MVYFENKNIIFVVDLHFEIFGFFSFWGSQPWEPHRGAIDYDYFFHETGLTEGIYVREGDKVEFKIIDGDRGQKAVEISIID